ncbi:methyltransferase [Gordonia desulfuricans]|uniref:methyltransferase n=1 Tax=Gordonia desulfuricans TaxID=89051 RepID=UPI003084640F
MEHGALRCPRGHTFDLARQGHVTLLDGRSGGLRADTADMVAARLRVHEAGVLDAAVDALADALDRVLPDASGDHPLILDLGGGPGVYLRACLRRRPSARGLVIDLSKFCARAVTRGEPAAAAVVADAWRAVPVRSGAAAVVLSVFAPRNVDEIVRMLAPGGHLLVVTPLPSHLTELIEPLGMLSVTPDKTDRLDAAMAPAFELIDRREIVASVDVDAATIADLVGMGPSAFHHDRAEIDAAARRLADAHGGRVQVTVAVTLTVSRVGSASTH